MAAADGTATEGGAGCAAKVCEGNVVGKPETRSVRHWKGGRGATRCSRSVDEVHGASVMMAVSSTKAPTG